MPDLYEWMRMNDRRKALKDRYRSLFDAVTVILFEEDPISLGFGENADEYEPETGAILARMTGAQTVADVQVIVYEEFVRQFSKEDVDPPERFFAASARIWEAWRHAFPENSVFERRDDSGSLAE